MNAFKYIYENYITDETCSPYQSKGYSNGVECTQETICKNCNDLGVCFPQQDYYTYQIEEYGYVKGEEYMMNEIYQRGPIVCGI